MDLSRQIWTGGVFLPRNQKRGCYNDSSADGTVVAIVVTVMMSQLAYSPDGTVELNEFTLFLHIYWPTLSRQSGITTQ